MPTDIAKLARTLIDNLERVMVGQHDAIELLIVALLAGGHVLIEDVPGTGKTTLARALAVSLGLDFKRVQCTPDLLPGDITGAQIYNPQTTSFEFRPGPVFAGIVLADEINRATPRTQSALLEAMQERQVTSAGETYPLPDPFLVLATQNPVEYEGTFPLPEAQLDRFLLRVEVGYPNEEEELDLLERIEGAHPLDSLGEVVDRDLIRQAVAAVSGVHVSREVRRYIVRLVRASRHDPAVDLGLSPRAAIALQRAAQAHAGLVGRDYVAPDDVKRMLAPVAGHRLAVSAEFRLRGGTAGSVVDRLLDTVVVDEDE